MRSCARILSSRCLLPWAILVWLTSAGTARAVDGVIELNNARAVEGGVTPGDAPGYPVTIDQPGSYRLTGPLFVSGTNVDVVEITADHVTVDLNGFEIRCLWFVTPCAGNGSGRGIDGLSGSNISVRNGTVRDIAEVAIALGPRGRVHDVRTIANGYGISAVDGEISSCLSEGNLGYGFQASNGVVRDSVSRGNAFGLSCGPAEDIACRLVGSVFTGNSSDWRQGSFISLGQNLRCDAEDINCVVF